MSVDFKMVTSADDLQKAFCIRHIVFVDEQDCPYELEHDQYDLSSTHFLGLAEKEPVCTARIRLYKGAIKIERFAVRKQWRGKNVGADFLQFILAYIKTLGVSRAVMNAQAHAINFYERHGFLKSGEKFLEAGIDHYHMEKNIP